MKTTAVLTIEHDDYDADGLRALLAQFAKTLKTSPRTKSLNLKVTQS